MEARELPLLSLPHLPRWKHWPATRHPLAPECCSLLSSDSLSRLSDVTKGRPSFRGCFSCPSFPPSHSNGHVCLSFLAPIAASSRAPRRFSQKAPLCSSSSARARRRIGRPFRNRICARPRGPRDFNHRPLFVARVANRPPRRRTLSYLLAECLCRRVQDASERSSWSCRRRSGERLDAHTACVAIDCPKPVSQHLGPFSRPALGEMAYFLDGKLGKRLLMGASTGASAVVKVSQAWAVS